MDDTNPTKEEVEYVDSIIADVKWLIEGWADDRLGLKAAGKTPQAITSNGQPDFYLAPTGPKQRRKARAFLCLGLFRSNLRICRRPD